MKAVRIHSYGDSDQLKVEDLAPPEIKSDEVLVEIHDAGVNPVDWKIREGYMKGVKQARFPLTIGQDFAGEIVRVGGSVRGFAIGDRVFGFAPGAYAEYAAISAKRIARIPEGLDFETAAALPTAGLTAWQAITRAVQLSEGQAILIHGAAGGVGSFAAQIAKWLGAKVIGTASTDDIAYLESLGIERAIDYRKERFEEVVRGVDAVLDLVGGETLDRSYQVVNRGGVVVTTAGSIRQDSLKKFDVRGVQFVMSPDAEGLAQLAEQVARGVISPRVSEVLPLEEARRAHDLSQKGHPHGKIVLEVTH